MDLQQENYVWLNCVNILFHFLNYVTQNWHAAARLNFQLKPTNRANAWFVQLHWLLLIRCTIRLIQVQ